MKVIWRNNKAVETGQKGGNQSELKKPLSHNSLTKMKGYNHRLSTFIKGEQCPEPEKITGAGETEGQSKPRADGDAAQSATACRVCGRTGDLRRLDDSTALLEQCFGVKVPDSIAMICKHCADLISYTYKFKEMICAAFQTTSSNGNSGLLTEVESLVSITKPNANFATGSEELFLNKINMKRKSAANQDKTSNKKTIVVCIICKQRYPMMAKMDDYVCSRCKVKSNSDRTVACVKCRTVVPRSAMKDHLRRHAKADLKGRCRLRSLTKQPSNAQTEGVSKSHKQAQLKCPRCQKSFTVSQLLERHLRDAHGAILTFICQVCGKDMRGAENLDKHMKIHVRVETFECQVCGRIFKDKSVMERHSLFHGERTSQVEKYTAIHDGRLKQ